MRVGCGARNPGAANGEQRTTQVPQLDTAGQTAEHYFFELLSQLGETRGRPTRHEFLAVTLKNRGSFENPQLLNARDKRATPENLGARRRKCNRPSAIIP